jgi:AAA+ superfamily predicted ATPase
MFLFLLFIITLSSSLTTHAMDLKVAMQDAEDAHAQLLTSSILKTADTTPISSTLTTSIFTHCPDIIKTISMSWRKKYDPNQKELTEEEQKKRQAALADMKEKEQKKYCEEESSNFLDTPKAWFFVGPSGTGKSTIGKAIAKDCNIPFFMFTATSFSTGIRCSGIEGLNTVFKEAASLNRPCIVIIDELGGLIKNHHNKYDPETNMLQCLWTLLDRYKRYPILFIGTLNDTTDSAQPIKDRFANFTVRFSLPDKTVRENILKYYMDSGAKCPRDTNVTAQALAGLTDGFSQRGLEDVIERLKWKKLNSPTVTNNSISMKDCEEAINNRKNESQTQKDPWYTRAGGFISKHSGAIIGTLGLGVSAYALYDNRSARKESARLHQENLDFQRKTFAFQQQQAAESARLAQELQTIQRATHLQQQFDRSIQGQVARGLGQGMAAGLTQPKVGTN